MNICPSLFFHYKSNCNSLFFISKELTKYNMLIAISNKSTQNIDNPHPLYYYGHILSFQDLGIILARQSVEWYLQRTISIHHC